MNVKNISLFTMAFNLKVKWRENHACTGFLGEIKIQLDQDLISHYQNVH